MLILYFKNLLFLFLVDFKLRKSSLAITATCNVLIDICPSCFVYDFSNTILCPIGNAMTKYPVASQICYANRLKWLNLIDRRILRRENDGLHKYTIQ